MNASNLSTHLLHCFAAVVSALDKVIFASHFNLSTVDRNYSNPVFCKKALRLTQSLACQRHTDITIVAHLVIELVKLYGRAVGKGRLLPATQCSRTRARAVGRACDTC